MSFFFIFALGSMLGLFFGDKSKITNHELGKFVFWILIVLPVFILLPPYVYSFFNASLPAGRRNHALFLTLVLQFLPWTLTCWFGFASCFRYAVHINDKNAKVKKRTKNNDLIDDFSDI